MRPRWITVDPGRGFLSDEFQAAMERDGTELLDGAGMAYEQHGKVERHGQWFESILNDVIAEIQPQNEDEWLECVAEVQCAKNSLLSVGGTSPCQICFGVNPEVPGDLLVDNPDVHANSAILHDDPATRSARVRACSRRAVLAYNDKIHARAALEARPRTLRSWKTGDMVAVWRMVRNKGLGMAKRHHHRWRPGICMGPVRGNYWVAVPGSVIKASPEQMRDATKEERAPLNARIHARRLPT